MTLSALKRPSKFSATGLGCSVARLRKHIAQETFFCELKGSQRLLRATLIQSSAGDAAHSFPPTGGLGLNSGLGDVHNLAYKIAFVLRGEARDSLLDTYDAERRHVAIVNSVQSVKNGKKIFELLKTLGMGDDLVQARQNLHASLEDPNKKRQIDKGVEDQREHFDNVSFCVTSPKTLLIIGHSSNCILDTFTAAKQSHRMPPSTKQNSLLAPDSLTHGSSLMKILCCVQWIPHISRSSRPRRDLQGVIAHWIFATLSSSPSSETSKYLAAKHIDMGSTSRLWVYRAINGCTSPVSVREEGSSSDPINIY